MAKASARGRILHAQVARRRDFGVDLLLDFADQFLLQPLELEIHAPLQRLHVAAGDARAVIAPDDAAEDVHRRVRAHQLVAPLPVEDAAHLRTDGGQIVAFDDVDVAALDFGEFVDVSPATQFAEIVGLTAAAGIKGRAVEQDAVLFLVNRRDDGVKFLEIAVGLVEEIGHQWILLNDVSA